MRWLLLQRHQQHETLATKRTTVSHLLVIIITCTLHDILSSAAWWSRSHTASSVWWRNGWPHRFELLDGSVSAGELRLKLLLCFLSVGQFLLQDLLLVSHGWNLDKRTKSKDVKRTLLSHSNLSHYYYFYKHKSALKVSESKKFDFSQHAALQVNCDSELCCSGLHQPNWSMNGVQLTPEINVYMHKCVACLKCLWGHV